MVEPERATALVWMSGWQMECCADPVTIGDEVTWPLTAPDHDWLDTLLGTSLATEVTHELDRHDDRDRTREGTGRVRRVRCVHVEYAPVPKRSRDYRPVPGSAELVDVSDSRMVETSMSGRDLAGYLFDLDLFDR